MIEDVPEQRELAVRMLSQLGYSVDTVATGEEALRVISSRPYDLILLDMVLAQGERGLDVYRSILEEVPGQRCILVSGWTKLDQLDQALKMGAHSLVRKPYTMHGLGVAVREALDAPATDTAAENDD